ncbi:Fe-S biogenesis protein NfuA [Moritella viscosa]|uniref:Fe/S biogenesis protein NfuA n=1 Tax=Moritella viscosa TaxID=80854 RepID=A0A090IHJ1_9GAMM|nr:Fe-S biogenesis protein NfuA [Moritella viscosa]CED62145.1 Fe/S biogenesis protein NfuA [Moritella viscosa]SGY92468.1 Fe/S biogenesis protein nfuA [Moritella viscosa]SGY96979.1 Fe/S biogenesis protein nfuA [Moritella viscosa]SGY97409.1 Fe/S biogenesis protein nfuA [Moritella viscosa]SGZ02792.1 Fe/S biogenesis protein nfuA [Moritella viscosa]
MITITEAAQTHFVKLLSNQKDGTNIRVFVVNPGTANAECGVSYCPPEAIESSDIVLPYSGFDALIDDMSKPFLTDAYIDFVTDKMGSQLTLKAPNAKIRAVADDAPLAERVDYVIQTEVNPQLAGHGGNVVLTEITDDGIAILQFGGGCNGCSQVDFTLKEGIEKQLLELFPEELTAVKDATEHQAGEHSYY